MTVLKSLSFILFLATMPIFNVAHTHNCYYDEPQEHIEYVCDGLVGDNFDQTTYETLYCPNTIEQVINRREIKSLSFINCSMSEIDSFNLWDFYGLRALNISYFGLKALPYGLIRDNIHLERFIVNHNQLTELPGLLFDTTPEIVEVDFSFNEINQIARLLFDNTRKLKIANFSFNNIYTIEASPFSILPELEVLDLSDNNLESIDPNLLMNNKKLKSLNLNNNQLTQLDCQLLINLAENSLDIYINTVENMQTNCPNGENPYYLDITMSPEKHHLQISDGQFKWSLDETDFTRISNWNSDSSSHFKNSIKIISVSVLMLVFIVVILITSKCKRTKNYQNNLSIFSVEPSLIGGDNQYEKMKSQQTQQLC